MSESGRPAAGDGGRHAEPVIKDHRRIDPVTGQVRYGKHAAGDAQRASDQAAEPGSGPVNAGPDGETPAGAAPASGTPGADKPGEGKPDKGKTDGGEQDIRQAPGTTAEEQLAERTADLQRLQAEYVNYRKRVDRDRAAVKEQAVASTLTGLLPVLDAIEAAREHGELSGGFKSVADQLQAALARLGLAPYRARGDLFDPKIHEALTYLSVPDLAEDTCAEVLQPGYRVGERILRPARVAVAAPAADIAEDGPGPAGDTGTNAGPAGTNAEQAGDDTGPAGDAPEHGASSGTPPRAPEEPGGTAEDDAGDNS